MRKFSITSPSFSGEIFIEYNKFGVLHLIDASQTKFNEHWIQGFVVKVPKTIDAKATTLATFISTSRQTLIIVECYATFEAFWDKYDKKINKKRVEKLWNKLSEANKLRALNSIVQYDKHLKYIETGRGKADPENYIRKEMYLNEWNK